MQNDRTIEIQRLRTLCQANDASPLKRANAATNLLAKYGATRRNLVAVKITVAALENYQDASLAKQQTAHDLAEQLEHAIKFAVKAKEAQKDFDESDADDITSPNPTQQADVAPTSAMPATDSISGIELLPPDDEDEFWDATVYDKTRREIVGLALGLPAFLPYTRQQAVETLASRLRCSVPEIEFHPGQNNPPWSHDWIPSVAIRGAEQNSEINGQL